MIGPLLYMFTAPIFFFWEIPRCAKSNIIALWQTGPPGLAFYGNGLACLPSWLGMVNADCGQKSSCKWNLSLFKAVPPNRLFFYLGSLLHIIISLFRHFKSWDYPRNFGIYSQRKSKAWSFTFLNVVCFMNQMGQNPNLTAFTSNIQVFCRPEWTKGAPYESEFWQFSNSKIELGLKKQMKKTRSLVLFSYLLPELWSLNCQKLCPFCKFLLIWAKNLRLL